jgi:hypothetical protein
MPDSSKSSSAWAMPAPGDIGGALYFSFARGKSTLPSIKIISAIVGSTNSFASRPSSWRSTSSSAYPQEHYFETAEEKRRYFIDRFKIEESLFSPTGSKRLGISFSERFPLCVAYPAPEYMPVVTFTYIDPQHRKLDAYIAHLRKYRPLFPRLPSFQFVYVSTASGLQNEARELFSFLVEGKGLSDLIRYFDHQTKWDRKQYGLLTENAVLFLSDARKRFTGPSIATLYYLWKRNRLPKDLQPEAIAASTSAQKILFRAVTVAGHESIFGDSTKNWGDGWEIRGCAGVRSSSKSPARATQGLHRAAHA